jgi:hypothetical protein
LKNSEIRGSAKALMTASSSADGINRLVYILAWIGGLIILFTGIGGWEQGQGFLIGVAIAVVFQATLVFLVVNAFTAKLTMDANVVFQKHQDQD